MRRSNFYLIIATAILFLMPAAVSAQTGQLFGRVLIQQADGTKVPAAGALVDVYRVDMPGKYPTKADNSGRFVYAGLPFVGTYVITASAPNAAPQVKGGVKVGQEINYEIVLLPGDGRRLTEEEAKTAAKSPGAAAPSGGESAADKAKREEIARKNAEIAEANKKIENANQVISEAFRGGNAALTAKNYDEAIRLYDTGLGADPAHPGLPSLLTNKSVALRLRGVDRYNVAIKSTDAAAKSAGLEAAKADFKAAADASSQAVDLLKKQTAPADPGELKNYETNKHFALNARAEAMRLFVGKADGSKADLGVTAYEEYIAAESDATKKTKAQYDMAQMLFDAAAYDKAKVAYEKILAEKPDDPEALSNMGLILFNFGALKEGEGKKDEAKAMYQQAANYLQQFVDKAPDTHRFKADAKAVLDALKTQQNVQAEKGSTPPRRRRP